MRVLLSGATGLIGKKIGEELVRRGHQVTSLSRDPDRARASVKFQTELRKWENYDQPPQLKVSDHFDAVVNLAGEPIADKRWTEKQKQKIRDSRVVGTRTLIEALKSQTSVRVWVQGSAIGIYGDRKDEWLDENSRSANDFLAQVVREWEKEAQLATTVLHSRLAIIRTGIVLSEKGGALQQLLNIFRKGIGGKLGDGSQYFSWIHLDDIAALIIFALENEVSGIINGTAPEPVTNAQLTLELSRALGKREFFSTPKFALKLALGEMASSVLSSTRVKSRAFDLGFKFKFENLDQALRSFSIG